MTIRITRTELSKRTWSCTVSAIFNHLLLVLGSLSFMSGIVVELRDKSKQMAKEMAGYQQAVSVLEKKYAESCQDCEELKESTQKFHEEVTEKTNKL